MSPNTMNRIRRLRSFGFKPSAIGREYGMTGRQVVLLMAAQKPNCYRRRRTITEFLATGADRRVVNAVFGSPPRTS